MAGDQRPTLADVATRAGVSRTTVSNAYNRPDQLSENRRRLVLAAAAELGYAGPDPLARSLRTGTADAVGLIFSAALSRAFSDPAAVEFLQGVAEVCEQRGRSLLLIPAGPEAANTAMVRRAAADGFIVYSMPAGDPHVETVLARPEPVVIVDSPADLPGTAFVGIDDRHAFAGIARHVVAQGHERIGLVTVHSGRPRVHPLTWWRQGQDDASAVFAGRLRGLVDVVGWSASVRVYAGAENAVEVGRAGAAALLDRGGSLTAIMCTSDALAFGVLAELAERGVAVPGDVSVTGFDDVPTAQRAGLTSVSQPARAKGRLAAQLLLDGDDGDAAHDDAAPEPAKQVRRILATALVVRATSGRVRAPVGRV